MSRFHVTGENHQSKCVSFRRKTPESRMPCHSWSFRQIHTNPGMCHSGPRPGIQPASVPLCLSLVSFLAQTRNPCLCACLCAFVPSPLCASVPSPLCAFVPFPCVIPGPDPESSLPLCLCAFVPFPCVIPDPDPESSLPLCLCAFPPLCLCAFVPLCLPIPLSFPVPRPCVIPGPDPESRGAQDIQDSCFGEYCPVFLKFLHSI